MHHTYGIILLSANMYVSIASLRKSSIASLKSLCGRCHNCLLTDRRHPPCQVVCVNLTPLPRGLI